MTHLQINKLTEKLVSNISHEDASMILAIAAKKRREYKAARKKITDALFLEATQNKKVIVKESIVIADDAAKYSHNRFGVGLFVSEDEKTITLSFDGQIKVLVKAFNILTKI